MRRLLDTNAYTEWKKGRPSMIEVIRASEALSISTIVVGELLFGFRNGGRYERNRAELEALLGDPGVDLLPVTLITADRYSRVTTQLRRKGRPIPTNDVWIAAHALESGAELVSFDEHFAAVDGLAWLNPAALEDGPPPGGE